MQSSNPMLSAAESVINAAPNAGQASLTKGQVQTAIIALMLCVFLGAGYMMLSLGSGSIEPGSASTISMISGVVYLLGSFALIALPTKTHAPVTALLSVAAGVMIGSISFFLEASFPGIVLQAVLATGAAAFAVISLYSAGVIKVTQKFKAVMTAGIFAILILYIGAFIYRLVSGNPVEFLDSASPLSIGISFLICGFASLSLALDLDRIDEAVQSKAPGNFAWILGFGIVATLVWMYVEILRLLAKLRSGD